MLPFAESIIYFARCFTRFSWFDRIDRRKTFSRIDHVGCFASNILFLCWIAFRAWSDYIQLVGNNIVSIHFSPIYESCNVIGIIVFRTFPRRYIGQISSLFSKIWNEGSLRRNLQIYANQVLTLMSFRIYFFRCRSILRTYPRRWTQRGLLADRRRKQKTKCVAFADERRRSLYFLEASRAA